MHLLKVPPVQVPSVGCGIGPAATIGREEAAEAMAKRLSLIFIYFVGWCGILFCLESGGGGVDGIRENEWSGWPTYIPVEVAFCSNVQTTISGHRTRAHGPRTDVLWDSCIGQAS